MRQSPMPFNWPPDPVSVWQFASRVRGACAPSGTVTTAEIGYQYSMRDGTLYRVVGGNWQPIGDAMEIAALPDEQIYARCRA